MLKLKDLARGGRAKPIDWLAGVFTLLASAALAGLGWFRPDMMHMPRIVPVIFGVIGMRLACVEMLSFVRKPKERMFWWYTHLGNFIGSYIAAWSAFSVTAIAAVAGQHMILWLWPTLVGVPAILVTTAYYKRKFSVRRPVAAVPA